MAQVGRLSEGQLQPATQWFPVVLGVLLAEVLLLRLLREGVVLLLHPARAGRQQLQVVRFAAPYLPSLYS